MFSYETIGRACKHRMIVPAKAISDIPADYFVPIIIPAQFSFFNETRQIKLLNEGLQNTTKLSWLTTKLVAKITRSGRVK